MKIQHWIGPFALALSSANHALIIDDFTTAQQVAADAAPVATDLSSISAPESLGGERDLFLTKTHGIQGERVRARINMLGSDYLRMSTDTANGSVSVTWDGVDNDAGTTQFTGLGGLDLLANGGSAVELGVEASDVGGPVHITVWDANDASGSTFARGTLVLGGGIASIDPTIISALNFSNFTVAGAASYTDIFSSVGAIAMEIDATAMAQEGWDLALSFIRTNSTLPAPPAAVPEPMSFILLSVGLIGMTLFRRRRTS